MSDSWRWWPDVLVRGAGFPAEGVLRLADSELADRADTLADGDVELWQAYQKEYEASALELSRTLREIAASDDFQTAVTWQNHRLIDGAIVPFLRWRPGVDQRNSKHRQREELVASYWQRYCVKNDSIGFFGPVGWGALVDEPATRYRPGTRLLRSTATFFEAWAIDRLAEVIGQQPRMREWVPPRRLPFIRLDGDTVVPPLGPPVQLSPVEAGLLRRCDGKTPARDLAAAVGIDLDEAAAILDDLRGRRWIAWQLELPLTPWPERELRAFLGTVADADLRNAELAKLDRLESARAALGRQTHAAGLAAGLVALDGMFSELTGSPSTRNEGRSYGGRTLVYQDCQRDITLDVGQDLVEAAAPLSLLGSAARWFTWRLAQELREPLHDTYRRLSARDGARVDLGTFWFEALRQLHHGIAAALVDIRAAFAAGWEAVFDLPDGVREVVYSGADLAPRVRAAFDAPAPGWGGARYLSPDVMVAARDVDALRDGDFRLVLGELHMAINTQRSYCFVTQHPRVADLMDQVDIDFPGPRLLPVLPKSAPPRLSIRTHPAFVREQDFLVEFNYHTVAADRPRLVSSYDVSVEDTDGRLVVRLPGGEVFDVLDVFAEILMGTVIDQFRLFDDRAYVPRITVDRMVICRERWRFDAGTLAFAGTRDEARRFVEARAWRRSTGMPRHVFVKPPAGEKPVFVDFDSPIYLNVLAKIIRRARDAAAPEDRALTAVEMLPSFDELWMTDGEARRYTSELRFALVDLRG